MSFETQKADPALHEAVLKLMRLMKGEQLFNPKRSLHEYYVRGSSVHRPVSDVCH